MVHGVKIYHFTETRLLDFCSKKQSQSFYWRNRCPTLWLRSAGSARNLPTSVRMALVIRILRLLKHKGVHRRCGVYEQCSGG